MKCKLLLTNDKCSCYLKRTEKIKYELLYIEGEFYFDLKQFVSWTWETFIDYICNTLNIVKKQKSDKFNIKTQLTCELLTHQCEEETKNIFGLTFNKWNVNFSEWNLLDSLKQARDKVPPYNLYINGDYYLCEQKEKNQQFNLQLISIAPKGKIYLYTAFL